LAGGAGTRLYPSTKPISKQLLSVYDKPMIYYPLSVLMLAKIKHILIITNPEDQHLYRKTLGFGENFGIRIEYASQKKPEGLAQAFLIAENFIGNNHVSLILGDNIFLGSNFVKILNKAKSLVNGANIFASHVSNPSRFGVFEFDSNGKVKKIVEKPKNPKSNYAQTGLFFYDNKVVNYAKNLKKSKRGEYEITDLNKMYLKKNKLETTLLSRGFSWFDTGTNDTLLEASQLIRSIQEKNGLKIACLEEIAFKNKWIDSKKLKSLIKKMPRCNYSAYLNKIANLGS
jgi:glucose-1-phosphate thymidylyltransferase